MMPWSAITPATVRWGGRIIRTEPRPDRTCFEVISTRLDAKVARWWASDDTWGRFIACRTGFYDPALFEPKREVTFTGRIEGYEERKRSMATCTASRGWPPMSSTCGRCANGCGW